MNAMTNPDNVGGLPELPELPDPEVEGIRYDAFSGFQVFEYARAYGELCIADARRTSSYWKAELVEANKEIDRLRELCRVAPAGGDVERDADFYSAGYANGYKHATKDRAPAGGDECGATFVGHSMGPHGPDGERQCKYCGESAPAGPGEVELEGRAEILAREFHEAYERLAPSFGYETRKETRQFDPTRPNGCLMIAVCDELLRKLSQGADYVMVPRVPTEAMLEAAHEAAHVWRANAWRDAERARYAAMIAASQGQDGGTNG